MKRLMTAAALSLLAGCAPQSAQMVKDDPGQPSITYASPLPARDTYERIEASLNRCARAASNVSASFISSDSTGQVTLKSGEFVETVLDIAPADGGSKVTIYPNIHRKAQLAAWPKLLPLWMAGDASTCIGDVL